MVTPEVFHECLDKVEYLARKYAKDYNRYQGNFDDFNQIGREALLKCARSWDGKNVFWTYARHRVEGSMLDEVRKLSGVRYGKRTRPYVESLDQLIDTAQENDGAGISFLATVDKHTTTEYDNKVMLRQAIKEIRPLLNEFQRDVFDARMKDYSLKEIAEINGVSPSLVSLTYTHITSRLKERINAKTHNPTCPALRSRSYGFDIIYD